MKTWQKWQTWDPAKNDKFQGYAILAVRGAVLMAIRRQTWFEHNSLIGESRFQSDDGFKSAIEHFGGRCATMESSLQAEEAAGLLAAEVESLPPLERHVVKLVFFEGLPLREVFRRIVAQCPVALPWFSQKHVVQIRDQAIGRLRESMRLAVD